MRPDARLILVGDADQLASVEAGAVLADLVDGLVGRAPAAVAGLRTPTGSATRSATLAESLREGDADRVLALLSEGGERVELVDPVEPPRPRSAPVCPSPRSPSARPR